MHRRLTRLPDVHTNNLESVPRTHYPHSSPQGPNDALARVAREIRGTMTDQELIAIITKNVQTVFKQEDFAYEYDFAFRDIIGFDSVQAVMFILEMESALGITLHEDEVDRMHTTGILFEIAK